MNNKKLYVFSQPAFEAYVTAEGITDENVANNNDIAIISIIGTDECLKHFFNDHHNVLNLEFDDIDEDTKEYNGRTFYGLTKPQAKRIYKFIDAHKGKDFLIHCRAGRSRSQSFARYILDVYGEEYGYTEDSLLKSNPCNTPNIRVLTMLKREYYQNNNLFQED